MLARMARLRQFFSVSVNDPELLKAQYRAFAYQLPMLYCILLISSWIMVLPYIGRAPAVLAVVIPVVLTAFCVTRAIQWWSRLHADPCAEEALAALRRTNMLAPLLSVLFTGWAILLFPYGDTVAQDHIAFFMGITAIGCIFCLMHLRSAAFLVALIDNAFMIGFLSTQDNSAYAAIAANVVLVTGALLVILLFHYRDFARMVTLNAENRQLANCDSLTGLPNRRHFFEKLDAAVASCRYTEGTLAVGIIDLDGFKPINDLYGHVIGDRLLCAVTERLSLLCAGQVDLARLGGDEFALLVTQSTADEDLRRFGTQLCDGLRAPFRIGDVTVQIGGSLGFASFPDHARTAEQLYELADYALYHGKRHRRGTVNIFTVDHDTQIQRDAAVEIALRKADLERELVVVFQPIVDIASDRTVAFEALARWKSVALGDVPPTQFIPIAERSGLIGRLTVILLGKALAAARHWPDTIRLSFNLSAHDLCSPQIVLQIIQMLNDAPIETSRIDLEITETALLHDMEQVQEAIRMLKLLGCSVSLDDFGTGYSSLSHLHALPFTKIKIDRSFVQGMDSKPASYKIVKSLLALTRDMGIDCVVEGVETVEEMSLLRELGGKMVQGYYFSRPMEEKDIAGFLADRARPEPMLRSG